ncbi:MAG: DNA cytosine methyltransferase [Terriglobales bacterium]
MSHNVVDLFSGAGGLSLGAARAGFIVRGAVELDPQAISSHRLNFPRAVHLQSDVSQLTGHGLRASMGLSNGDLTGIIGGPPCQGFSCIGRNNHDDDRNKLFEQFFRIVGEALPKFFLAENVPGILSERNSRITKAALSHVERKYVVLPPMVISANEYGAPTQRRRIFFFGYLPDEVEPLLVEDFQPPRSVRSVHVRDALRGLPTKIDSTWQEERQGWRVARAHGRDFFAIRLHGRVPAGVGDSRALERLKNEWRASGSLGTVHSKEVAARYAAIEPGKRDPVSKSHRLDPDGFCPTLRAGTGSDRGRFQAVRPLHPTENRVITPREAARLQGFPDWFQFSPSKWHSFRQIGSSVSPILAERILMVIRKAVGDSL